MLFGNKFEKIAKLAEKGEEEKLVSFVNDKHEDVHLAAIDALGRCSGDVAFNALVPLVIRFGISLVVFRNKKWMNRLEAGV